MTAAARTTARVLFAGALLLLALPLTAATAAAAPAGPGGPGWSPAAPGVSPAAPGGSPGAPGGSPAAPGGSPAAPGGSPAAPGGSPAAPGGSPGGSAPAGTVTATATVDCGLQAVIVTARNTTAAPVTVGAFLNEAVVPAATLAVPAGDAASTQVRPGEGPFELAVRRLDTSAVLATATGFFSCPARTDLSVRVRSGQTFTSGDVCAVAFFLRPPAPRHGTVRVTERGFTYRSVAGYTGPDRFDYECLTSESVFGTVRVTVLPVATPAPSPTAAPTAAPAPPVAGPPALPATGTSHLPVLLGSGLGLIAAGALTLRLARR